MRQGYSATNGGSRSDSVEWDPFSFVAGVSIGTGRDLEIDSVFVYRGAWGQVLRERWDLLLTNRGLPWIPEEMPGLLGIEVRDAVELWRISCADAGVGEIELRALFRANRVAPGREGGTAPRAEFHHGPKGLVVSWRESPGAFVVPVSLGIAA